MMIESLPTIVMDHTLSLTLSGHNASLNERVTCHLDCRCSVAQVPGQDPEWSGKWGVVIRHNVG
jgi:hypothetical protein